MITRYKILKIQRNKGSSLVSLTGKLPPAWKIPPKDCLSRKRIVPSIITPRKIAPSRRNTLSKCHHLGRFPQKMAQIFPPRDLTPCIIALLMKYVPSPFGVFLFCFPWRTELLCYLLVFAKAKQYTGICLKYLFFYEQTENCM